MRNSFDTYTTISTGNEEYSIFSLAKLKQQDKLKKMPFAIKVLLENCLRKEDGLDVTQDDIQNLINWGDKSSRGKEIAFYPARVLMQDFTGVPAVVDLAAMRDALASRGSEPQKINPLIPVELVIDHSVQVDHFGNEQALQNNIKLEFSRNHERYEFLRWGQEAFENLKIVPPGTGIVHQVNLEYLARTVFTTEENGVRYAYPDTLVGTDSHTTMINGLGVLGWGVGGIEAEAAMLGQPISMLLPEVVGFRLSGKMQEGITATDLVLTIVELLRKKGVVGKFVEFYGPGLDDLSLADRATIANMAPEYGATCGIFPIDEETVNYLSLSGREKETQELVRAYAKHQGMWREKGETAEAEYTDIVKLDIGSVEPSLAGPKRPQDRIALHNVKNTVVSYVTDNKKQSNSIKTPSKNKLEDGSVVIAAITSCTNTSNPSVMIGAGLLAQKAIKKGLHVKPWVKTSLAPGSKVVKDYLDAGNLTSALDQLGFNVVGYGCTTCIGNSGPLPEAVTKTIKDNDLVVSSVLSGNRNFEGRVHSEVKMNFLASPPLVVAYAIAGTTNIDLTKEPLAKNKAGEAIYLKDIWPTQQEINATMNAHINSTMFRSAYGNPFVGDENWQSIEFASSKQYNWKGKSTYIRKPDFFEGKEALAASEDTLQIEGARVIAKLGDSITTDHISPAGSIKKDSPAGSYLIEQGVSVADFNSYGSRRGNHEIMVRGTFANVRLRNQLVPKREGGWTVSYPSMQEASIYDVAMQYKQQNIPLVVLAGKEYGTGSSRDWAAKGTKLLGIVAVIAESFERIHRSNLVGMGVLPIVYPEGKNTTSLGLKGNEIINIRDLTVGKNTVTIEAISSDNQKTIFEGKLRIDTPKEWDYYLKGGILSYVLDQIEKSTA